MSVASEQASIALDASTSRARCRRRRQADATRRRAGGGPALPRPAPGQVPRRPRHLLVRAVRRLAAHARPRARARGARSTGRRSAGAPRSATRWRARSSCSSPSAIDDGDGRPSAAPPPPAPQSPRRGRSRRSCCSPTAPRRAARCSRSRARQRAKSYGIPVYTVALGTPNGVDQPRRVLAARAARSRHAAADRPAHRRRVLRDSERGHLNAVYEDLASRLGQKKEWRELSFALAGPGRAVRPRRGRALAAVGSATPVRAAALIALAALGLALAGCGDGSQKAATSAVTVAQTVTASAAPAADAPLAAAAPPMSSRACCRAWSTCGRPASTAARARPPES